MKPDTFTATIQNGYALFWKGIFSNFYPCIIYDDEGHRFISSEQMFMYSKAIIFQDMEIAKQILLAHTPKSAKALGREVKGFDSVKWDIIKQNIMFEAVKEKFIQNLDLREEILSDKYEGLHFVEASPFDRIWGIGFDEENAFKEENVNQWGQNLLGITLDQVRLYLK